VLRCIRIGHFRAIVALSVAVNLLATQVSAAQPQLSEDQNHRVRVHQAMRGAQQPAQNPAQPSQAAAATQVEVLVLRGSQGAPSIDPSLGQLPMLRRPPFSVYPRISLITRSSSAFANLPTTVSLPNNGTVSVSAQRQADGRYTLSIQVENAGRRRAMQGTVTIGEPFFFVASRGDGADGSSAVILAFFVR